MPQTTPSSPNQPGTNDYVTDKLYWALCDNLGSVRDLAEYNAGTDTTTIANHRVFDAFGNITSETASSVDHLFAYTGRVWDEDAGLYNYRTRSYDPETGKFLSEDWIGFLGGDANLTRYVGNNALNYIDPWGLWPAWFGAADFARVRAAANIAAALRNDEPGFWDGLTAGWSSVRYALTYPIIFVFDEDLGATDFYNEAWEDSGLAGTWTQDVTDVSAGVGVAAGYAAITITGVQIARMARSEKNVPLVS